MTMSDQEKLIDLLQYIQSVFKKNNVLFWLDAGTLLKSVRNGDIIPSGDIDFGTWQKEIINVLAACQDFQKDGYQVRYQGGLSFVEDSIRVSIPQTFQHIIRNCAFDIYLYGEYNNEAYRRNINRPVSQKGKLMLATYRELIGCYSMEYISIPHRAFLSMMQIIPNAIRRKSADFLLDVYQKSCETMWYVFPAAHFHTLKKIQLYGLDFFIPENTKEHLALRYGGSWEVPSKNYRLTDGNFVKIRRLNHNKSHPVSMVYVETDYPAVSGGSRKSNIFKLDKLELQKLRKSE